jgi:hypothetical protein
MTAGQDVFLALDVASSELGRRRQVNLQEIGRADRTGTNGPVVEDWLRPVPIASTRTARGRRLGRLATADARARRSRPARQRRCLRHQPEILTVASPTASAAAPLVKLTDRHGRRNARCRPDGERCALRHHHLPSVSETEDSTIADRGRDQRQSDQTGSAPHGPGLQMQSAAGVEEESAGKRVRWSRRIEASPDDPIAGLCGVRPEPDVISRSARLGPTVVSRSVRQAGL